jgi:hypothetical protein
MSQTLDPALVSVTADLHYQLPMADRPRTYTYDPPDGTPRSNAAYAPHRVRVADIRPRKREFSLDTHGFAVLDHPSALRDFDDEDAIRRVYYPEAEAALAAATGASRVFIFDHTIRRRIDGAADRAAGAPRQPVPRVHVDHTAASGPGRVRAWLPEEAEQLLRGRVQVINLWRPITGPLQDFPLAVADARTIPFDDLVAQDLVYPDRVGETYGVTFSPAHRWYYLRDMQPNEALLLKCYDSRTDGTARFAPHTAFDDPTAPADRPYRHSIELRTLVFHPN